MLVRSTDSPIKKIISVVLVVFFIYFLIAYFSRHGSDFKKILELKAGTVGILVACYVLSQYVTGLILKLFINKLGGRLTGREGFFISLVTSFFNFITPFRGGVVVAAVYLKRRHQFDYSKYLLSVGGNYVILFLLVALFNFAATVLMYFRYHILNAYVLVIFICLLFFLLAIMFFSPSLKNPSSWIGKKFNELVDGWKIIKSDRPLIGRLFLLNLAYILSGFAFMWVTFWSLGVGGQVAAIFYLHSVSFLSFFVNITPAALGIYETVVLVTSRIVGLTVSDALLFAIIFRVIGFGSVMALLLFYSKKVYRLIKPDSV